VSKLYGFEGYVEGWRRFAWRTQVAGVVVSALFVEDRAWAGTLTITHGGRTLVPSAPARFFAEQKGHPVGPIILTPGDWFAIDVVVDPPCRRRFAGLLLGEKLDSLIAFNEEKAL
jgi:hypothetical protein